MTNGTLDIDSTPASSNQTSDLSVDAGTFAGDGDVTVSGTFTWSGGAVEGAGTLLLDATSVASIDSPTVHDLSRRIENRGATHVERRHDPQVGRISAALATSTTSATSSSRRRTTSARAAERPDSPTRRTRHSPSRDPAKRRSPTCDSRTKARSSSSRAPSASTPGPSSTSTVRRSPGGTWGVGFDATLRLLDADIVTNRAELLLDGPDATLQSRNTTSALAHLAVNDGGLALAEGADLTVPGDLTNNGRLALSSDSVLTVNGNYTQRAAGSGTSGPPDVGGELQVDIGDLANAVLHATGKAALAGASRSTPIPASSRLTVSSRSSMPHRRRVASRPSTEPTSATAPTTPSTTTTRSASSDWS